MGTQIEKGTRTWHFTLLLTILVALGAWNTKETHGMRVDMGALQQMVVDGKETRLAVQRANDADHDAFQIALKQIEKDIVELRLRLTALEKGKT
jgi:hypothetical protein